MLLQFRFAVDIPLSIPIILVHEDFRAAAALEAVRRIDAADGLVGATARAAVLHFLAAPPLGEKLFRAMGARVAISRVLLAANGMVVPQAFSAPALHALDVELGHKALTAEFAPEHVRRVLPTHTGMVVAHFLGGFLFAPFRVELSVEHPVTETA
jgi:hypothetical protein